MISEVSERLLMRDDISYIEVVPKALALSQFSEDSGLGDLIAELGANPLPDALLITPLAADITSLERLTSALNQDPDIDSAELDSQWLMRLKGLIDVINRLAMLVGGLSVLAFFLVIGTSVRGLIQSSIDDIRIQKLIGATDLYIVKPLVFKGLYYGFSGASLAFALQFLVFAVFNNALADFLSLYSEITRASTHILGLSWLISLTTLSLSSCMGATAAYLFAKQQILTLNPA
jgi:cell division transport system permease protein